MPTPSQPNAPQPEKSNTSTSKPSPEVLKTNFDISESDESDLLGGPSSGTPAEPETKKPEEKKPEEKKEPVVEKKEPEVKKPEEKKPEIKAEEKKEPEAKEEGPNILKGLTEKKAAVARDYTGFTEDEVKALKSMSNEAFNYVAPILKSRKELEKLKDATYLQHPESYVLHPEYREKQRLVSQARREATAWQQLLVKIRQGEEWTPLVGVDPKTGEFVYGEKRKPTVEDEEQVRMSMNRCLAVEQQTAQALQQLPQQFQQTIQQDNQLIQAERAKRFDWVANPELLKYEVETDGGKKTVQALKEEFTSLFPAYHQRSVGVEVASDLWVALQVMSARLKLAEQGKAVAEVLKEEATRVEPTSGNRERKSNINGKHGVKEFDLEGMPT